LQCNAMCDKSSSPIIVIRNQSHLNLGNVRKMSTSVTYERVKFCVRSPYKCQSFTSRISAKSHTSGDTRFASGLCADSSFACLLALTYTQVVCCFTEILRKKILEVTGPNGYPSCLLSSPKAFASRHWPLLLEWNPDPWWNLLLTCLYEILCWPNCCHGLRVRHLQ